jgi:hypothetical protein
MLSKRWLFLLLGPVPHYPPFLGSLLHAHKKKSFFFLVFGSLTSVPSVPVTEARTEGTTEVQLYESEYERVVNPNVFLVFPTIKESWGR